MDHPLWISLWTSSGPPYGPQQVARAELDPSHPFHRPPLDPLWTPSGPLFAAAQVLRIHCARATLFGGYTHDHIELELYVTEQHSGDFAFVGAAPSTDFTAKFLHQPSSPMRRLELVAKRGSSVVGRASVSLEALRGEAQTVAMYHAGESCGSLELVCVVLCTCTVSKTTHKVPL
jgi:hypothetical protein